MLLIYVPMKCILAFIFVFAASHSAMAQGTSISDVEASIVELERVANFLLGTARPYLEKAEVGAEGAGRKIDPILGPLKNPPDKIKTKIAGLIDQVASRGSKSVELLAAVRDSSEFIERTKIDSSFRPEEALREIQSRTGIVFFTEEKSKTGGVELRHLSVHGDVMNQYKADYIKDGPVRANEKLLQTHAEVELGYAEMRKGESGRRVRHFAKDFGKQYLSFCAANGIIAVFNDKTKRNPMEIHQAMDSCFDILGATGFMAFMAGNHMTQKLLRHSERMPGYLKSSLGMGVGLLMSSITHEFLEDLIHGDLMICWTKEPSPERSESCRLAKGRWFHGDKYWSYAPNVVSLLGAVAGQTATRSLFVRMIGKVAAERVQSSIYKFARIGSFYPGSWILNILQFTVFLAWDRVLAPPVTHVWGGLNFNSWGISNSESLRDGKGALSELLRTHKDQLAEEKWFEVQLQNNPEIFLSDESSCEEIQAFFKRARAKDWGRGWVKNYEACQRREQVDILVYNRFAFQNERTRLITQSFVMKQQNWQMLLADFIETYDLTYKFIRLLVQMKQENEGGGMSEDDLDEALSASNVRDLFERISQNKKIAEVDRKLNGLPFTHLADFIVYSLVCGPSVPELGSSDAGDVIVGLDKKSGNPAEVEFIKTPFGSGFEFIPPKITVRDSKVCNFAGGLFRNKIYEGQWTDATGHTHKNLARYLYENLDEDMLQTQGLSPDSEFHWWDEHIASGVQKVWAIYDNAYKKLIKEDLVPLLTGLGALSKTESFWDRINPFYDKKTRRTEYWNFMGNEDGLIKHYNSQFLKNLDFFETLLASYMTVPSAQKTEMVELRELVSSMSIDIQASVISWENTENPLDNVPDFDARWTRFRGIYDSLMSFTASEVNQIEIPSSFLKLVVAPYCNQKNLQMILYMQERIDAANYGLIDPFNNSDLTPEELQQVASYPLPLTCSQRDEAQALLKERILPQAALDHLMFTMNAYIGHVQNVLELAQPFGF